MLMFAGGFLCGMLVSAAFCAAFVHYCIYDHQRKHPSD